MTESQRGQERCERELSDHGVDVVSRDVLWADEKVGGDGQRYYRDGKRVALCQLGCEVSSCA